MSDVDEYPPFTSLAEYPPHPAGYGPATWWACRQPERPRDHDVAYDWRCRACVMAAAAHVAIQGDVVVQWTPQWGEAAQDRDMSWMVARSVHWFTKEDADGHDRLA